MSSIECKCCLVAPISLKKRHANHHEPHLPMGLREGTPYLSVPPPAQMSAQRQLYLSILKCPQEAITSLKARGNSLQWPVHFCAEAQSSYWMKRQVASTSLLMPRSRLPFAKSSMTLCFLQVYSHTILVRSIQLILIYIAVAHRLRTVIDYDRLIVLDKGRVGIVLVTTAFLLVNLNICRSSSLIHPST